MGACALPGAVSCSARRRGLDGRRPPGSPSARAGCPGGTAVRRALGVDRTGRAHPRRDPRSSVVSGTFVSPARLGARIGWSMIYPGPHARAAAGAGRPARPGRHAPLLDRRARDRPVPGRRRRRPGCRRSRSPPSTAVRPTGIRGPTARTPAAWSSRSSCRCWPSTGLRHRAAGASTATRWVGTARCGSAPIVGRHAGAGRVGAERRASGGPGDGSRRRLRRTRRSTTASRCSATRATSTASRSGSTADGGPVLRGRHVPTSTASTRPMTSTFEDGAHDAGVLDPDAAGPAGVRGSRVTLVT